MKHAQKGLTCGCVEKPEFLMASHRVWAAYAANVHILLTMHSKMH